MEYFAPRFVARIAVKVAAVSLILLSAELVPVVSNSYALNFYGAEVTDADLPSSYMRVGLFGVRPVVGITADDNSTADSGFQRGDIIISVNGTGVKNSIELNKFTTDTVSVTIFRYNEKKTLFIKMRDIGKADAKQLTPEKQIVKQQRVVQDISTAAAKSPSIITADRANRDVMPAISPIKPNQAQTKRDTIEMTAKSDCSDVSAKCTPNSAPATSTIDLMARPIDPVQDQVLFENSKGDVTFSHLVHLKSLNKVQCLSCHNTDHPTPEKIQARLDNHRAAHGFCRGCHQNTGKGPTTECHVCHNSKLKKVVTH